MSVRTLIIVHGEKPPRDGSLHPAFRNRLDRALRLGAETIVVTGGTTRLHAKDEATQGEHYLREHGYNGHIIKEQRARSTAENVLYTKELIEHEHLSPATVYVVSSGHRMLRIRHLYKHLNPELLPRITFVGARNAYAVPAILGIFFYLKELALLAYHHLDPHERMAVAVRMKVLCRGGRVAQAKARGIL